MVCVCVQVEEVIERLVSALSDKDTGTVTYPIVCHGPVDLT